jgi:hypothetical protein
VTDETTARPAGTPHVPGRIVEGIREAIADPKRRPGAYIRLTASGGVHGEEYEFEYVIDASGTARSRLRDELHGRHLSGRDEPARRDPARFTSLAEAIDVESLMRAEDAAGGFPPDSVVGRLEVSDGEQRVSFAFLADEGQAARAQIRMADPLRRAVDVVYGAAAEHLDERDLKP